MFSHSRQLRSTTPRTSSEDGGHTDDRALGHTLGKTSKSDSFAVCIAVSITSLAGKAASVIKIRDWFTDQE